MYSLVRFMDKFERLQQSHDRPIKVLLHIEPTLVTMLQATVERKKNGFIEIRSRLKSVAGRMLVQGKMMVTNEEVWDILKFLVRPTKKTEVEAILNQSVFPSTEYNFFNGQSEEFIQKSFKRYISAWLVYTERFFKMLTTIGHETNLVFFPDSVIRRGKAKGITDYYLAGAPEPEFALRLQNQCIRSGKLKKIRTFEKYVDCYVEGLEKFGDELQASRDILARLRKGDDSQTSKPPMKFVNDRGLQPNVSGVETGVNRSASRARSVSSREHHEDGHSESDEQSN